MRTKTVLFSSFVEKEKVFIYKYYTERGEKKTMTTKTTTDKNPASKRRDNRKSSKKKYIQSS